MNFSKFLDKFILPDKRGFKLMETRRAESFLLSSQAPFVK